MLSLLLICAATSSLAETPQLLSGSQRIRVSGKEENTITTNEITLGDISDINSDQMKDDDAIIALQKIKIADAPKPGEKTTLTANSIIEKMRAAGVNLNQVGYMLPKVVSVIRASRKLTLMELQDAIESSLKNVNRDVTLKSINYYGNISVSPGAITLKATPYGTSAPGEMRFQILAKDENDNESRFALTAKIEEWIQVPVASRSITRGSVIGDADLQMARMNVDRLPRDAASDQRSLLGYELTQSISAGDTFRRTALKVPPLITQGGQVIMRYRKGLLEATATGTALEAGIQGQQIKVKNDSSKKVVVAKVVEPGLVEVEP